MIFNKILNFIRDINFRINNYKIQIKILNKVTMKVGDSNKMIATTYKDRWVKIEIQKVQIESIKPITRTIGAHPELIIQIIKDQFHKTGNFNQTKLAV